jgi:hypothetical protein
MNLGWQLIFISIPQMPINPTSEEDDTDTRTGEYPAISE